MSPSQDRALRRVLIGSLTAVAGGVAALSFYAKKQNLQSPAFLAKYLLTPNSLVGPLFPLRRIRRADVPIETPKQLVPVDRVVAWRGAYQGLTRVLRETETNTFIVVKDGVIVHEWCREGYTVATKQSSWSVAKSVVGLVVGQLIHDGLLTEDTRLVEVLPEYQTGGPFDSITVGQLLDMRSGIDLEEVYSNWRAYTGVAGMMTTKDLPTYLQGRARGTFAVPGTVSDYRSVDTQYLSMIITRLENRPLADVVRERIWNPIGAVDDATWTLDHEEGIEKGFMGLNASTRDFLRLGLLMLNRGRVGDTQVVPEEWIDRAWTPAGLIEGDDHTWGYSTQWWHPTGSEEHDDLTALGVNGQFVYVNRKHGVVIAKNSDYGSAQDEEALIQVFREIAETL